MLRFKLILLGILVLILITDVSIWAHVGGAIYPIVELTDSDLTLIDLDDGSVDDWITTVGDPTLTPLDFLTGSLWGTYNPISFDFQIWLAWHKRTNRLYVAIEQIDDYYFNEFSRDIEGPNTFFMEMNDSFIGIAVDGDHSGGEFRPQTIDSSNPDQWENLLDRQAQEYWALGEIFDDGSHLTTFANTLVPNWPNWPIHLPYAYGGGGVTGENPTQVITEFFITPFDDLIWHDSESSKISELQLGKIIGLKLHLVDHDGVDGEVQSVHFLPEESRDGITSSASFADFILVDPKGALPQGTNINSNLWGEIKNLIKYGKYEAK